MAESIFDAVAGSTPHIKFGTANVTTSANGNFGIAGLNSNDHILLGITITNRNDTIAIPYKYGSDSNYLLGGHAMSALSAQTAVTNASFSINYAYVEI